MSDAKGPFRTKVQRLRQFDGESVRSGPVQGSPDESALPL